MDDDPIARAERAWENDPHHALALDLRLRLRRASEQIQRVAAIAVELEAFRDGHQEFRDRRDLR